MIKRDVQRMFDLVRYCRAELHQDGLITDDEYAELLEERGSVDRLEKYDRQRDRIKELEDKLAAMSKDARLLALASQYPPGETVPYPPGVVFPSIEEAAERVLKATEGTL